MQRRAFAARAAASHFDARPRAKVASVAGAILLVDGQSGDPRCCRCPSGRVATVRRSLRRRAIEFRRWKRRLRSRPGDAWPVGPGTVDPTWILAKGAHRRGGPRSTPSTPRQRPSLGQRPCRPSHQRLPACQPRALLPASALRPFTAHLGQSRSVAKAASVVRWNLELSKHRATTSLAAASRYNFSRSPGLLTKLHSLSSDPPTCARVGWADRSLRASPAAAALLALAEPKSSTAPPPPWAHPRGLQRQRPPPPEAGRPRQGHLQHLLLHRQQSPRRRRRCPHPRRPPLRS